MPTTSSWAFAAASARAWVACPGTASVVTATRGSAFSAVVCASVRMEAARRSPAALRSAYDATCTIRSGAPRRCASRVAQRTALRAMPDPSTPTTTAAAMRCSSIGVSSPSKDPFTGDAVIPAAPGMAPVTLPGSSDLRRSSSAEGPPGREASVVDAAGPRPRGEVPGPGGSSGRVARRRTGGPMALGRTEVEPRWSGRTW